MYDGTTLNIAVINEAVKKMVDHGFDLKKLTMLTPLAFMKEVGSLNTHYGVIKVMYNPYLPPDQFYLMNETDIPDEWKLPHYAPTDGL